LKGKETIDKITELTKQIAELPKGYISKKQVGGQVYFYHQWSQSGIKQSRYLKDDEIQPISELIEKRKELQQQLREIKLGTTKTNTDKMICTLMHKTVPVADIELDNETGFILHIDKLYSPEHLPIGISVKKGVVDRSALNDWWTDRSIPASRSGVREALENLKITNTKALLVRCYGLSLSDQYWIRPENSDLTWKKINFFQNDFSEDIGDVLFGTNKKRDPLDFSSPDNTSDGNLKKRWKIINGKRCLVKGGSNPYRQQPLNEMIATEVMKRLSVPCVPYSVTWNKGVPYSICADFIDENTELVPAWRIIQTEKKDNRTSMYQHFINCADRLGIPDVKSFIDRMITADYIIANEDRHLNNFGAVRNAETLEWLGMAPIYDSGSSLGYDKIPALMRDENEVVCKPFKKHHEEQLKLVSDFGWVDFSKLQDVPEMITEILSDESAKDYMDENRIGMIAKLTQKRIEHLKEISENHKQTITLEDDVKENIAEDYKQ